MRASKGAKLWNTMHFCGEPLRYLNMWGLMTPQIYQSQHSNLLSAATKSIRNLPPPLWFRLCFGLSPVVPRTVCQTFLLVLLRNLSEAGNQTRCVQDQSVSYPGLSLGHLFLFRVTLSSAQTLLLALHTGITSPQGMPRMELGLNVCKASTLLGVPSLQLHISLYI